MSPVFRSRLFLLILVTVSLLPFTSLHAAILFTRIQIAGQSADDEYVEITNTGDSPEPMSGFVLSRQHRTSTKCSTDNLVSATTDGRFPDEIDAGETLFVTYKSSSVTSPSAIIVYKAGPLTGNDILTLLDPEKHVIDQVGYGTPCDGYASPAPQPAKNEQLVRRRSEGGAWRDTGNDADDFEIALPPDTTPVTSGPGATPSGAAATTVRLNEVLPNPKGDEAAGEFIELYNFGTETVDVGGWTLRDASKTGRYAFPSGTLLEPGGFLTVYRTVFKFALNNTKETVSLFDPSGGTVSTLEYAKTKEDVSFDFSPSGWRQSRFLTPGTENILNDPPDTKTRKPKTAYVGVSARFSVKAKDKNGDKMKYVWDFGDGHRSYLRDTSHVYPKKGKYTVTITVSDGSEETVDRFGISVGKYPEPKVRIVSLVPNPAGRDTENEWIEVANLSKKTVRLKDWKIATRSKTARTFVNHAVLTDIRLKPGEIRKITRTDSRFSLNNKALRIALRNPAGKTVQELSYERTDSAPDDAQYRHVRPGDGTRDSDGTVLAAGWRWIGSGSEEKKGDDTPSDKTAPAVGPVFARGETSTENRAISPETLIASRLPAIPSVLGTAIASTVPTSDPSVDTAPPARREQRIAGILHIVMTKLNAWVSGMVSTSYSASSD